MEKQKREKNGVDGLIIFGRISRVGVAGVSEDGCQKISCKVSGNFSGIVGVRGVQSDIV